MAEEILTDYQHVIETFTFITSSGGAFEFKVNGDLLYSKKATKRHAEPGEVLQLFREYIGPGVESYPRNE